ncbi:hypothetical protein HOM50_02315 [bacterium]|jgi:hypothetical protein|nr:hypothetical protein [bacterium]MBT5015218.1 hypothetical protein [bacterium]
MNKQILMSAMISTLLPLSVLSHPGDKTSSTLSLPQRALRQVGRIVDSRLPENSLVKGLIRGDSHLQLMLRTGAPVHKIEKHLHTFPNDIYVTNYMGESALNLMQKQLWTTALNPFADEVHVSKIPSTDLARIKSYRSLAEQIEGIAARDERIATYHHNRNLEMQERERKKMAFLKKLSLYSKRKYFNLLRKNAGYKVEES